jgi:hypothetical protein
MTYDYDLPRFAAEQRGYVAHIRPRGEDALMPVRQIRPNDRADGSSSGCTGGSIARDACSSAGSSWSAPTTPFCI